MKIISVTILLIFMFTGCSDKKIEITSEYIINENWDKKGEQVGSNSIKINRMKLKKDSMINPFSDLSQEDILNKLEEDSSFIYVANIKIRQEESYKGKKIYFNRDNGFYWWTNQGNSKTKILGRLEVGNWYVFSRLNPYYEYVYVDSVNKVHRFNVNLANY